MNEEDIEDLTEVVFIALVCPLLLPLILADKENKQSRF